MRLAMAISPSRDSSSTHFAQIHAHGIVGALAGLGLLGFGDGFRGDLDEFVIGLVGFLFLLLFVFVGSVVGFGHVDAHVGEHRHDVFDLLRRGRVGREHFVELIEGHEAALLGLLDHLLDGGVGKIEQRGRSVCAVFLRSLGGLLILGGVFDRCRLCLGGHSLLLKRAHDVGAQPAYFVGPVDPARVLYPTFVSPRRDVYTNVGYKGL